MQFFGLLAFTIIFAFVFMKLFFPVKSKAGLVKLTARLLRARRLKKGKGSVVGQITHFMQCLFTHLRMGAWQQKQSVESDF
jgi:hypothetical protein